MQGVCSRGEGRALHRCEKLETPSPAELSSGHDRDERLFGLCAPDAFESNDCTTTAFRSLGQNACGADVDRRALRLSLEFVVQHCRIRPFPARGLGRVARGSAALPTVRGTTREGPRLGGRVRGHLPGVRLSDRLMGDRSRPSSREFGPAAEVTWRPVCRTTRSAPQRWSSR